MISERRVVITGVGAVTPLGDNIKEIWENVKEGKSGISLISKFNPDEFNFPESWSRIAGEIKNFDLSKWNLNTKEIQRMDPVVQYAIVSAKDAIEDSGLNLLLKELSEKELSRIGCQIGSGVGGLQTWEEQFSIFREKGPKKVSPFFIPSFIINMLGGEISIIFGLRGPNVASVSACASGGHAIAEAFEKIKIGKADIMLAGGAEAPITPLGLAGFNRMRALSSRNDEPEKASRPFDKNRDGFVLAEGAGILVLEELKHAEMRGAKIYAELISTGMSADSYHITQPSSTGAKECMMAGLREGGIKPEEVDHINAHGTSTILGDVAEADAIKDVFGEHAHKIPITSTKSMTGHMIGGAGAVEAIFTVMSIKEGVIPPTINLENLDERCGTLDIVTSARKAEIRTAISNSFGFGGQNVTLIFRKI